MRRENKTLDEATDNCIVAIEENNATREIVDTRRANIQSNY